jgi:hypothetical protein
LLKLRPETLAYIGTAAPVIICRKKEKAPQQGFSLSSTLLWVSLSPLQNQHRQQTHYHHLQQQHHPYQFTRYKSCPAPRAPPRPSPPPAPLAYNWQAEYPGANNQWFLHAQVNVEAVIV